MSQNNCLHFMNDPNEWYVCQNGRFHSCEASRLEGVEAVTLYEVQQMDSDNVSEYLEAYENLLDSLQIEGLVIIYMIYGGEGFTRYLYGITVDVHKNLKKEKKEEILIEGKMVFEAAFAANFPSANVVTLKEEDKEKIINTLSNYSMVGILEGVPGLHKEECKSLGVDCVTKTMASDDYMMIRMAKPLSIIEMRGCEASIEQLCDTLAPLVSTTISRQTSQNNSNTWGINALNGATCNRSCTDTDSRKEERIQDDLEEGELIPEFDGEFIVNTKERQHSVARGENCLKALNKNLSNTFLRACSSSRTKTMHFANQSAKNWMEYINNVITPRLDYGKSRGLYLYTTGIFADNKATLIKLECALKHTCQCKSYNRIPIRRMELRKDDPRICCIKNLHFPTYETTQNSKKINFSNDEMIIRSGFSQILNAKYAYGGNWVSSKEMSTMMAAPQSIGM